MKRNLKLDPQEYVCPHIYEKYGENANIYVDEKLIEVLQWLKENWFKDYEITCNTYGTGDKGTACITHHGMLCNLCALSIAHTFKLEVFSSDQVLGKAVILQFSLLAQIVPADKIIEEFEMLDPQSEVEAQKIPYNVFLHKLTDNLVLLSVGDSRVDNPVFSTTVKAKIEAAEESTVVEEVPAPCGSCSCDYRGKFPNSEAGHRQFVTTMYQAWKEIGLPDHICIAFTAQSAMESGWGTSAISGSSNYGGIARHGNLPYASGSKRWAGYRNLGHYVDDKLNHVIKKNFSGALTAPTIEKVFYELQHGRGGRAYCGNETYGGVTTTIDGYGPSIINGTLPRVQRYLGTNFDPYHA